MKHPLLTKIAALAAITTLLLIGLGVIADIVRDRQRYRSEAARSVAQSLAGPQTLLGPMLHIACVESWEAASGQGEERTASEQRREFMLSAMPERLQMQTSALMEERARGLHKVNAFTLKAQLKAHWPSLASLAPKATVKGSRLQCGPPILMLAVADARGIRMAHAEVLGQTLALKPGTLHPAYARGLHAALPEALPERGTPVDATVDLELVGTQQLSIVPLGDMTEVRMQGDWQHPSFAGRFLPSERELGAQGFTALWRLSSLATTAQQDVLQNRKLCATEGSGADAAAAEYAVPVPAAEDARQGSCTDSFSVAFVDPVNPYSLADRATKYGLLFIALTFVAVGLFELMKQLRVHPVQYLLVGMALCSFFLLLLSLSEHLPFGVSYAAAAAACVLLLGYYASHMLGSALRGLPFGAGIALLYGLLYVLLQLEQTALAVGSVALFLVLGAVMVLTRKVNWYGRGTGSRATLPQAGATAVPGESS